MSDFYDEPETTQVDRFGPVFVATYEGDCASCADPIVPGEDIRADGRGGWIHADDQCERVAAEVSSFGHRPVACPACWTVHGPGQRECS